MVVFGLMVVIFGFGVVVGGGAAGKETFAKTRVNFVKTDKHNKYMLLSRVLFCGYRYDYGAGSSLWPKVQELAVAITFNEGAKVVAYAFAIAFAPLS